MAAATIADVARAAHVSIKTVSRVINREAYVRAETRARVEAAAQALDYRPNPSARRLAADRSFLLALAYDTPNPHYVLDVQAGALAACAEERYGLLPMPIDPANPAAMTLDLIERLRRTRADAVILTPPVADLAGVLEALDARQLPYAGLSSRHAGRGWLISCNDEHAMHTVTGHLIGLGHRAIGHLRGRALHGDSALREKGFRGAMAKAGLAVREEWVVQGDYDFDSGVRAAAMLLDGATRPKAIVAANDASAAGLLWGARQRGLAVPGDLALTGFDDSPISRQVWPGLTTIRQPVRQMAMAAAQALIAHLRTGARADHVVLPYELVVRGSTVTL